VCIQAIVERDKYGGYYGKAIFENRKRKYSNRTRTIRKYDLKAGTISPDNRYPVVDKNGKGNIESQKPKKLTDHNLDEMMSDGVIFTPSESIDISQGVDNA